jgi:hypothetical protein
MSALTDRELDIESRIRVHGPCPVCNAPRRSPCSYPKTARGQLNNHSAHVGRYLAAMDAGKVPMLAPAGLAVLRG